MSDNTSSGSFRHGERTARRVSTVRLCSPLLRVRRVRARVSLSMALSMDAIVDCPVVIKDVICSK